MDWNRLKYTKSDVKTREENVFSEERKEQTNINEKRANITTTSEYRKADGKLTTSLIFVLSGGDKREKDFFKIPIKKEVRSLRILFMSKEGQGLLPYQMNEKWHKIQESQRLVIEAQEYELEELDKVFLVTDVDEFYTELSKISHEEDGLQHWIISNPCFETWLYYCYLNNPEEDLKILKEYGTDKRSQEFKKLQNELIPGGFNPIIAFEHMKEGINHSQQHYAVDGNNIPTLFSTQMHILANDILEIMERNNKEYTKLLLVKEKKRNMYRKK